MKRKILGLLFAFCLIVPCGAFLTACGGGTFSLEISAQKGTITLQKDKAKKGETVIFDVGVNSPTEDYVYELERVYYVVEGSEQENVLTSETSTYSFEMPKGNVVIYADVSQSAIYKDFSIFNGSLTSYYGNETNIVVPASNDKMSSKSSKSEILIFYSDGTLEKFNDNEHVIINWTTGIIYDKDKMFAYKYFLNNGVLFVENKTNVYRFTGAIKDYIVYNKLTF